MVRLLFRGGNFLDSFLSAEILQGLEQARANALRGNNRLRVVVGEDVFPIIRNWDGGFTLMAKDAPHLRGAVDIYHGANWLYECLVFCSAQDGFEMVYEYKRRTRALDQQPVDFVRDLEAPVALIGK